MPTDSRAVQLTPRTEQAFPKLSADQIARVARQGRLRSIVKGEVLIESGAATLPFFVVTRGGLKIVQNPGKKEKLITEHGPGEFTGETNMLSGRPSLVEIRASEAGEVIELDARAACCRSCRPTRAERDPDARVHPAPRRADRAAGSATSVLIGSSHCAGTRCASRSS